MKESAGGGTVSGLGAARPRHRSQTVGLFRDLGTDTDTGSEADFDSFSPLPISY